MTDRQRNGFVLLIVVGLLIGSLIVIAGVPGAVKSKKTVLGLDLKGGVELVYQGLPSPQTPKVTPDALQRAVDIMRNRVDQLGVAEPEIQTSGDNQITVGLPNVSDTGRAEREVGTTAQLLFYDWEANVITPNGKTVASQLQTQDPTATEISQGSGHERGAGPAGCGEHEPVRRGAARVQAAGELERRATRGSAPSTTCSGRPGARRARPRPRRTARCPRPASTACSTGPTTTSRTCCRGCRRA